MDNPIYTEFGEIYDEMGIQPTSISDAVSHSSKTPEQELAALKNRRARILASLNGAEPDQECYMTTEFVERRDISD